MEKSKSSNIFCILVNDQHRLKDKLNSIIPDTSLPQIKFDVASNANETLKNIEDVFENRSLFDSQRIIIIKNVHSLNSSNLSLLNSLLKKVFDSDLVIICGENAKNIAKSFASLTTVISINDLEKDEFNILAKKIIKEHQLNLGDKALSYLIEACELDIDLFEKRATQLQISFEKTNITEEHLKEIFNLKINNSVFELINLLDKKNLSAISYLNNFKLDTSEVLGMIALFAKHYQELLNLKSTDNPSSLKMPEWLLKKKKSVANLYSEQQLRKKLLLILQADAAVKNHNLGMQTVIIHLVKSLCA